MSKSIFQPKVLAVCLSALISQAAIAADAAVTQPTKLGDSSIQVIGGDDTFARDWMVSIGWSFYDHWCGGSLIDSQWVMTAAHCVDGGKTPGQFTLQIGARDTGNSNDGVTVGASEIHIHPSWSSNAIVNDIALIKLDTPVNNNTIGFTTGSTGDIATLIGWGDTSHGNGQYPDILQAVDLPVISPATCDSIWGQYGVNIPSSQLCASTNTESSCSGDSGGPLFVNENGQDKQIGVVSYGYTASCTSSVAPSVFTRVSSYTDWIDSVVNDGGVVTPGDGLEETNINIRRRATNTYTVDIPAGTSSFTINTSGGTGDADLFVGHSSSSSYACTSEGSSNAESCTISNPSAGTWNIEVYAYSRVRGLTLTANWN
ncbi:trypsin-like serine protease [Thalassomonas haliotis]|uniref:Trypsin-like serine protease n=1 Tax=Thalassomonas haliotis TaxID=485448 RepID=A0ABY7VJB2_9GAMM|nr:trypsin-like serine protease [Thalassomonas haliotis]WDE13563.1 trypsin-like serine protease [Thalassomonas haliotis]